MKKMALIAVLSAVFFLSACASAPVWKISKDGQELYLGGSIHTLRKSDYPLPSAFDTAYTNSDILVLEADIGASADPHMAELLLTKTMLPENTSLKDLLRPETYEALALKCTELGVPLETIGRFNPSMAVNILTVIQIQQSGANYTGVDQYYYERAAEEGKPMEFLETVEFQFDTIAQMGAGYEDEYILYSIKDMEQIDDSMALLIDEWKKGGTAELESTFTLMKEEFPSVYSAVFTERNNAWLLLIEEYLKTPETEFVVVGFGHLCGDEGLPIQLQNRGYTVDQFE